LREERGRGRRIPTVFLCQIVPLMQGVHIRCFVPSKFVKK
jgi:hypothetical protein